MCGSRWPSATLHVVLFTSFLGLAATGLPMRFSDNPAARFFAREVGRLRRHSLPAQVLRRGADAGVSLSPERHCDRALGASREGIFWGRPRWCPTGRRAGRGWPPALVCGLGPKPRFERYAYWEKFDYWAVFWGMIVIGFSGYAMWFAPFFCSLPAGWALNAVLVIHGEEALLAILFIFSIHFVNTHLRPTVSPWTW